MKFDQLTTSQRSSIILRNDGGPDDIVSVLLIPCFLRKEAEFFGLLKDPDTGTWRVFSPEAAESKEDLVARIDRTMHAEHGKRLGRTAA